MTAAAYAWRNDPDNYPVPDEVILSQYIDRFGVQAVYGRTPGAGELRRIVAAENIIRIYDEATGAEDWVAWSKANPDNAERLSSAIKAAKEIYGE